MNVAEAEKAFREGLPCETKVIDIVGTGRINKYPAPWKITYIRDESMLTRVTLTFKEGERATIEYPIEKLKLSEVV